MLLLRKLLIGVVLAAIGVSVVASAATGRSSQESVTSSLLLPGVTYTREVDFTSRGPIVLDVVTAPKPDGKLHSAAVYDGTGAVVKKGQTVFARYLGQVYKGKKPFDQNFDADTPAAFQLTSGASGGVIAGWVKALVGQRVGSEVVMEIPPKDGDGKAGNSQAGIKGTDTLYFVVDIVGAA